MNTFQKRALDLLDELLMLPTTRRLTRLLPCPDSDNGPIEAKLRELPWGEGWAFAVKDNMVNRLDIQYSKRVIEKRNTAVWTQGTNFDFSNITFHGQGEYADITFRVDEWRPKSNGIPATCGIAVYRDQGGNCILEEKKSVTDIELVKILIRGFDTQKS